jgi:hypothetical protein
MILHIIAWPDFRIGELGWLGSALFLIALIFAFGRK